MNVQQDKRISAVKRGRALVVNAAFTQEQCLLSELFQRMRDDEIKDIVMSDELICREAGLRMAALGNKIDQKQDDVYRVSQAARTLGRVVQQARLTVPEATLSSLLEPRHYDLVVEIAKKMSTGKDSPALNVGKTIGNLLTKVCMSKYCSALRSNDLDSQRDATNFRQLLQREWNDRVNRIAIKWSQRLNRMKVAAIPLTEDFQSFREYLMNNIE